MSYTTRLFTCMDPQSIGDVVKREIARDTVARGKESLKERAHRYDKHTSSIGDNYYAHKISARRDITPIADE